MVNKRIFGSIWEGFIGRVEIGVFGNVCSMGGVSSKEVGCGDVVLVEANCGEFVLLDGEVWM